MERRQPNTERQSPGMTYVAAVLIFASSAIAIGAELGIIDLAPTGDKPGDIAIQKLKGYFSAGEENLKKSPSNPQNSTFRHDSSQPGR